MQNTLIICSPCFLNDQKQQHSISTNSHKPLFIGISEDQTNHNYFLTIRIHVRLRGNYERVTEKIITFNIRLFLIRTAGRSSSMRTEIREEIKQDYDAVYSVNALAFKQDNEARLVNALRESAAFIPALSLVAVTDEHISGHLLFTKIVIKNDSASYESLALAPVAVHPDHQLKGIGSMLIRAGLQKARDLGYDSVIVLGHEHYYPKFGFLPAEGWQIKAPFDVPSAAFMALELKPGCLAGVNGTVEYAKEFEMV